jgi:hypothetical protein
MPKAYPIYDAEYRGTSMSSVRPSIRSPNLHTVGRNGMHKYNNQDHSMLTAMFAVENMQGAAHDIWAVNTDFEYHEEQRLPEPEAARRQRVSMNEATAAAAVGHRAGAQRRGTLELVLRASGERSAARATWELIVVDDAQSR